MVNRFQRLWNNLKFLKEILGFRKFLESEKSLSKMTVWQEPYVSLSVFNHGEIYDDFIIRHRDTYRTLPVWQLGLPTDPFWAESSHTFPFCLLFGHKSSILLLFLTLWAGKFPHFSLSLLLGQKKFPHFSFSLLLLPGSVCEWSRRLNYSRLGQKKR